MQTFGLPGQVQGWHTEYILLGAKSVGFGGRYTGSHPTWTFSQDDIDAYAAEDMWRYVDEALRTPADARPVHEDRVLRALELLSRMGLEQRSADDKLMLAARAVEALVGTNGSRDGIISWTLAQRAAFLTCGHHDSNFCGRDRPACTYLSLSARAKSDRPHFEKLLELSSRPPARCSAFMRIVELYRERNVPAHGGTSTLTIKQVHNATYSIERWLFPAAVTWFAENQQDIAALDVEIRAAVAANPPEPWMLNLDALEAECSLYEVM